MSQFLKSGPLHAPDFITPVYTYCGHYWERIAKNGESVTCIHCLKKLSQNPQYANYLRTEYNIDASGML